MSNLITYHTENNTTWSESVPYKQPDPFVNLPSPNKGLSFPTSPYLKLQPRKVSFTVNTLGMTTHIYTSPQLQDIIDLADYFGDWSCAYEIQEGPQHSITVSCPWDTISNEDFNISMYASEQWELVESMGTKPLLTNGLLNNSFTPISTANYVILPDVLQVAVQKAFDNKTDLKLPVSSSYSASLASYMPVAQKTLNYLRGGIEGVASYTQILKRTAVIDKENTNNAFKTVADDERNSINGQGSINYLYSTNDLITKFSIPAKTVGLFLLGSYVKKINFPAVDPVVYYAYAGWLAKPPTVQFIGRNKIQLTQEFVWNEFPEGLYYISSPLADFKPINF